VTWLSSPHPGAADRNRQMREAGLRLAGLRHQYGWKQQQLADQIGTTEETVSRWERGLTVPEPYAQQRLAKLFGLAPADFGWPQESRRPLAAKQPPAACEPSVPTPPPSVPANPSRSKASGAPLPVRARLRAVMGSVTLLVIVGVLVVPLFVYHAPPPIPAPSASFLGTVAFASSGVQDGNSAGGMNDRITMRLSLPRPDTDSGYYAWLGGDSGGSEIHWFPLGWLTWQSGTATLTYRAPQHTNLLVQQSHFLITQEFIPIPPVQPSSTWIAHVSISDTPTPGDPSHYSLLDHLRHLLAADPSLMHLGLHGGLAAWLARSTLSVEVQASGLVSDWYEQRFPDLRARLIRILDWLDGSPEVGMDVPRGTPLLISSPTDRVGLLTLSPDENPPGDVVHVDIHLEGVARASGATPTQERLAEELRAAMNPVGLALSNARHEAIPLLHRTNTQLSASSTLPLLAELAQNAQDAESGPTGTAGVRWIAQQIQQLASFIWKPA